MKRIGIIGAGRFGASLAESLAERGAEVLLIDQNREIIQEFSEFVTKAVEGDASNSRTLEDAGFQECDVVVYPNRDRAQRLARTLLSKGSVDLFEISDGFSIAEIDVPESLKNKSLAEAEVRKNFGLTVLCVRRLAEDPTQPRVIIIPSADEVILPDDKLLVFGLDKMIDTLAQDT